MFAEPQLAKDPASGGLFKPHHVNPDTGMYRGRQVIEVED
jgi:large subunit ribosomal protein L32